MRKLRVLSLLACVFIPLFGGTTAFLATKLNASDPDLVHILCPELTTGVTRDHKWLTREAIRRNLRQFFLDFPPPDQPGFNVPEKATLTELYHAYYGDEASPARFIKAVNAIAESNVQADSSNTLRYDPNIQADAEVFDDYQYSMADRYPQIITSIIFDEAYPPARSLLGITLHSLQKFYAHSTWIEQGNTVILEDLGLPAFPGFDDPAGPEEDVCTPCPNPQGECKRNVIPGAGITTGFYTYKEAAAASYLVPKPTTGGKCSHGGALDDTAEEPAIGGINKDTASPCFSPHYYLHDQAAELAVQATDHYLHVILDAVGVDKYRQLFDLYHGSALSIVMDTTGSMGSEIDAVKKQVHEIVESASASLYVLVPYNDPVVGPVTKTKDPDEFLKSVDALLPQGGGDFPEMFWGGLQLAITNTPDYGVIFCFTDATGKDGEKMEGDIAMAGERNTKVTVIYSGTETADKSANFDTEVSDYHYLCDVTGGLFIPSSKFDIGQITPLLDDSVESSEVDIVLIKEIDTVKTIEIPIDDTIFDFKVQVVGEPLSCILSDPNGRKYNIMDEEELESDPDIEVISYTVSIRALRWNSPVFGMWSLTTEASTKTLSVTVQGNSTLSWLGGFSILDPSPPHPHYMAVEGRPLMDTVYYIDVNLIGYLESDVVDVDHIDFVNIRGDVIRTIEYSDEIDDEFYIRTEPLPEERFYILLYGHLESGNVFCRLMSVLIIPVQASVEVLSTSEELSAKPGFTATGSFLVTNYGLESDFTITGNDEKGFMTSITPTAHILHNSSVIVTADFAVPTTAEPGTVSVVTVTAASLKQTESVNSAVTQFVVLPPEVDHENPTCSMEADPSCEGFTYVGVCQNKNWTASSTLEDNGSGMNEIRAEPEGVSMSVDSFTPGSQDPVGATATGSCCLLQATIIGVDLVGNRGACDIDMGSLGGVVFDFNAIEEGTTWVLLEWCLTPTIYDVSKYTLIINDEVSISLSCKETTCRHNATDLEPCNHLDFKLSPHFTIEGKDYEGGPAYTDASTLSVDPGAPINGKVDAVSRTSANVSWTPIDTHCISRFQVCVKPVSYEDPTVCDETKETSYVIENLYACATYQVKVTAIDLEGDLSREYLTIEVNTEEGLPGKPVNLTVSLTDPTSVFLTWYDPLENPLCVDSFLVSSERHTSSFFIDGLAEKIRSGADFEPRRYTFTENHLLPCTNYTFTVTAISIHGVEGPPAHQDMETAETDPVPIDYLEIDRITSTSMDVTWSSDDTCMDHYQLCYYNDYDLIEKCEETTERSKTLTGLLECVQYHISVSTVAPSGHQGDKSTKTVKTLDVAPGEPQSLIVVNTTAHAIRIQYEEPATSPQCANHYDVDISEKSSLKGEKAITRNEIKHHIFEDLKACTSYVIKVNAASSGGLASDWVTVEGTTQIEGTSEAREFSVESKTTETMQLKWFEPDTNGNCVDRYLVNWEGGMLTVGPPPEGEHLPREVEALVTELTPCTEYNFELRPITANEIKGPVSTLTATTDC